jgi:hypothetical protein
MKDDRVLQELLITRIVTGAFTLMREYFASLTRYKKHDRILPNVRMIKHEAKDAP